jgi:hypothetical protein
MALAMLPPPMKAKRACLKSVMGVEVMRVLSLFCCACFG